LVAVVGPCIGKNSYIVKKDLIEKFIAKNRKNQIFFRKIDNEKYTFDLRAFINKKLLNLNIKKIENIQLDTFLDKKFFFSYRRSRIRKDKDYGRCISVILMT